MEFSDYGQESQGSSIYDKIRANKGKIGLALAGISAGVIAIAGRNKEENPEETPEATPETTTVETSDEVDLSDNPADLIPSDDEDDEELEELDEIDIEE